MSLTQWAEWDKDLFNAYFEKPKLNISGDLLAPPLNTHYGTIGTAFDYLMRIKLYLHNYNFVPQTYKQSEMTISNHGIINAFPLVAELGARNKQQRNFIANFIDRLFDCIGTARDIQHLIPDCIILAHIESMYRSGQVFPDSIIFHTDTNDIKDLSNLIDLVDLKCFTSKNKCILNPTFGQSSQDICGADGDFIIDDTLIDIKTTKYLEFTMEQFRQLMGYYILNLRANNPCGEINNLGIYYSRFGKTFIFSPNIEETELFGLLPIMKSIYPKEDITMFNEWRTFFWEDVERSIKEYQEA